MPPDEQTVVAGTPEGTPTPDGGTAQDGGQVAPPAESDEITQLRASAARMPALEKELQRVQSMLGSTRSRQEQETLLLRQGKLLETLVDHLSDPDADPTVLKTKVQAIKQQEAAELLAGRTVQLAKGYEASIGAMLTEMKKEASDPRLAEAVALWQQAEAAQDPLLYFQAHALVQAEHRNVMAALHEKEKKDIEDKGKQEVEAIKQRVALADGTMTPGAGSGTPAGTLSMRQLTQPLSRDATLKEIRERTAALANI